MMTTARLDLAPIAKIEWRRPMIMDITPANRRPDADQAGARHREVKKRWQRQRERRSEEKPEKPDDVRLAHLRWRELQRLSRYRYGVVMPDTFEARRDLEILIGYAILTGKKPSHQADLWAPWLDQAEADHLAAHQRPVLHKRCGRGLSADTRAPRPRSPRRRWLRRRPLRARPNATRPPRLTAPATVAISHAEALLRQGTVYRVSFRSHGNR